MEVYEIAKRYYGHWIPDNILNKKPSAELADGQFDDNELLPYNVLDKVVEFYVEENIHSYDVFLETCDRNNINLFVPSDTNTWNTISQEEYSQVIRRIDNNEFKRRQMAPGTKISRKSFGIGRRVPIVKGKKT